MALNIHTDSKFEKYLQWLSRHSKKTKTDIIKELVFEKYHLKRSGFQFASLKNQKSKTSKKIQMELKKLDDDHDLD